MAATVKHMKAKALGRKIQTVDQISKTGVQSYGVKDGLQANPRKLVIPLLVSLFQPF
ncbi:MAG: hypothetical protein ABSC21_21355 [Terriglobia bacterium]